MEKEENKKKLLVEGNDDKHVIWALCEKFNIPEVFDVIDCKGKNNIPKEIRVRLKLPDTNEAIGIVVDADDNLDSRWTDIRKLLLEQGFNVPIDLPIDGLVSSNNDVKFGVWIMPDNNTNGMLEDFISFLVPQDDKLFQIVKDNLKEIEKQKLNKYSPIHQSKARIHSWLALQKEPGTPLGSSITRNYLTTDNKICKQFINWLLELFN